MEKKDLSKIRSIQALKDFVNSDPDSFPKETKNLIDSLPTNPMRNKGVFLTIIAIVGVVLLTSIILGAIIIFKSDDPSAADVPDFLITIAGTSLGAIVGLLAPNPQIET